MDVGITAMNADITLWYIVAVQGTAKISFDRTGLFAVLSRHGHAKSSVTYEYAFVIGRGCAGPG